MTFEIANREKMATQVLVNWFEKQWMPLIKASEFSCLQLDLDIPYNY